MQKKAFEAVVVHTGSPAIIECELIVVPVFKGETTETSFFAELDAATGGQIGQAMLRREFRPNGKDCFITPVTSDAWRARRVALVGVGSNDQMAWRPAAAKIVLTARSSRIRQVGFMVRGEVDGSSFAQAITEGMLFGSFDDRRYKTGDRSDDPHAEEISLNVLCGESTETSVAEGVRRGVAIGTSVNIARELSNEPPNLLTPTVFAERANTIVSAQGVEVEVLDEAAIEGLGMGMILGVAQGSVEPPRLVVMKHNPTDAANHPVLALVGKGVTFDTGGISIKPSADMDQMKHDMGGGAAVVGAMRAIGELQLPVRVIGIVPMVENMPGGKAIRPGDVLVSGCGKTVEVLNTDAEGRLILGDALWYARQLGATHLVDVATLTGSCVIALGKAASGLFGQPEDWVRTIERAANSGGERVWQLPLYDEYTDQLKSEIADLANIGGRAAGACTAAAFLRAFAEGVPWAHVDVAGTAWLEKSKPGAVKGATGVMVSTLTELASMSKEWSLESSSPEV
tara:strand:+ start:4999 stop:6537 length:1539 start_codon:yes stop_codon:yes gene_type:complete